MNAEQIAAYCLALPGAQEDYKWGGVRVFSIADTKMFAVMGLAGDDLSFKVGPELFLGYVDRPGVRPAPYLARAHWITLTYPLAMGEAELTDLLARSHQHVVAKLPKWRQAALKL
jgi:predicted DNA-binding protein (MmcQ/YjbR family)